MSKQKKVKMIDGSKCSAWQVLTAANAYYELSNVFTDSLPERLEGADHALLNMDAGVASATNRILALELYLKALFIGANLSFAGVHDLKALFDALPDDIRIEIERCFVLRCGDQEHPVEESYLEFSFQLCVDLATAKLGPKKASPMPDLTLDGLLDRNRSGFIVSRYLFESASHDEMNTFNYEHIPLAILCRVLCEMLELSLPNRFPWYSRTFEF
ncbi:hypothetical protein HF313_08775 [Massilia atriviolacea]|uniref:HEPN domain-containing protein n=1 Tax=Massilia atriviolacea TaxID=2495579 RepID=A0A430HDI4_9BURK|nr:hypothetical protein [Massilia atriviolacea]RSZ55598.1 hypothetical protein EJB06_29020 [Massilia atriviolacea]